MYWSPCQSKTTGGMYMSRSYKKYAILKEFESCKFGKRQANKRVRHYKGFLANGRSYKKVFDTWNICDYKYISFFPGDQKYKRK